MTQLEMTTNQDTISIPSQIDKGIDANSTKFDETNDDDLIFSFRNPTGSNWAGSIIKINLTKFKNEFSLRRSFDKIAFFGFCLGLFEFGSDGWLSYDYIYGANYTKTIDNVKNRYCKYCRNTELIKCTQTNTTSITQNIDNLSDTTYTYNCFERDPIWGGLTIGLIVLGGFSFVCRLRPSLNTNSFIYKCIEKLIFFLLFPLIFLSVKFVNIFTAGQDEWKTAAMAMTGIEGITEAQFQFMLQLFIIFKRADREPSIIQVLSLASSYISIAIAFIESIFADKPQTTIQTKVSLLPMALFGIAVSGISTALIISTIQWNYLFALFSILIAFCIYIYLRSWFATTLSPETHMVNSKAIEEFYFYVITVFVGILTLAIIFIFVNFYEEKTIWNWWAEPVKLTELAIVQKKYFNTLFGICLPSGVIGIILYYFQVLKPRLKEESEKIDDMERMEPPENEEDGKFASNNDILEEKS